METKYFIDIAQVITAFAAVVALFIGLRQLTRQTQQATAEREQARHLHEISMVLKFEERFESQQMRGLRRTTAEFLLLRSAPEDARWHNLSDFVDFFQVLGTTMTLGHLRVEVAYKWFSYWYLHYYPLCASYIKSQQENSPITWADAVTLYEQLRAYDLLENRGAYSNLSDDKLNAFLEWEIECIHKDTH